MAVHRRCRVCGTFYPSDRRDLEQFIASLVERVDRRASRGSVRGLVSPHAGYVYSGFTAAHGYALLEGLHFDSVVIMAPSHVEYFDGISVFDGDAYETPFGSVSIDAELREEIVRSSPAIRSSGAGHGDEHAIEVQLPFLQHLLGSFMILPIVVGDQRREYSMELGDVLGEILRNRNALLVASTDLSHYHSYEEAMRIDKRMIDDVSSFAFHDLMTHLETGEAEACGGGPTVAVMSALKSLGAKKFEVLHHCNSGDVTGDHHRVVGYLSAVALG